jgi:hypothetical protein
MRHARRDYDQIQDPSGKIPDDELVFLIRAQDANGPRTVHDWAEHTERSGGDPALVEAAHRWADRMQEQQNRRYHGGKVADVPEGMLRSQP